MRVCTFSGERSPTCAVRLTFWKEIPNFVGGTTDIVYGGIGTGMAFAKDAMASLSTLPIQNQYSSVVSETVNAWLKGWEQGTASLFNNPDALFSMIDNGALFGEPLKKNSTDMTAIVKKTLYASIISGVWTSGTDGETSIRYASCDV